MNTAPKTILIKSTTTAEKIGISVSTLHRWVKAGKIECIKVDINSVYFTQASIEEFLERHRKKYSPSIPV